METKEMVIKLYEELFKQCTLKSQFVYIPKPSDVALNDKFSKWFDDKYRKQQFETLVNFFEFQFSRYEGVETPRGKNMIMLNWLIGPKAIKEWEGRIIKRNWTVKRALNREVKLKLRKVFETEEERQEINTKTQFLLETHDYEEREKQRFFNTPRGLIYCVDTTTMYNPKSEICVKCENAEACIDILKSNFKQIYKVRNL